MSGFRTIRITGRNLPKAVNGLTVNDPDPDDEWIRKILEFEVQYGSADGTTLGNWGYNKRIGWTDNGTPNDPSDDYAYDLKDPSKRLDINDAIRYFKEDYGPIYRQYPPGLRERVADYKYNTGRNINHLLLYNAGLITLDEINDDTPELRQIKDRYGKASNEYKQAIAKHTAYINQKWADNQADITSKFSDENFINNLDNTKTNVYRTTNQIDGQVNPSFEKSWSKRVGIFGKYTPSSTTLTTTSAPVNPSTTTSPSGSTTATSDATGKRTVTIDGVVYVPGSPGYEDAVKKADEVFAPYTTTTTTTVSPTGFGTSTTGSVNITKTTPTGTTTGTAAQPIEETDFKTEDQLKQEPVEQTQVFDENLSPEQKEITKKLGANIAKRQQKGFSDITDKYRTAGKLNIPDRTTSVGSDYLNTTPYDKSSKTTNQPQQKLNIINKGILGLQKFVGNNIAPIGDPLNQLLTAATPIAQYFSDKKRQKEWDRQFREQTLADNLYSVVPPNVSGKRGDYAITGTSYGKFRYPEMGFKNPGMYYGNPGLKVKAYGGVIDEELELAPDIITDIPDVSPVEAPSSEPRKKTIPTSGRPDRSMGINPLVQQAWNDVSSTFKGVSNYGIWGDRKHRKRVSDHNTGDALDIGITNIAQGNQIAQKFVSEANQRNIKYIIFNRRIWNPSISDSWRPYTGPNPHTGHVHLSFNREADPKKMAYGGPIDEELSLAPDLITLDPSSVGASSASPQSSSETSPTYSPNGEFVLPVAKIKVTSGFGRRRAPLKGASTNHNGVDFGVPVNTEVFSPMDGIVENIYTNDKGGKQLIIRHTDGSRSGFAHLNGFKVGKGETVTRGQIVALSGNTGNSTGPHLHFTFRNPNGDFVDPISYFKMGDSSEESQPRLSNWEHYNPGNIHIGDFAKSYGAKTGRKDGNGNIAIFPNIETGIKAMNDLLFGSKYINLTVEEARNKWVKGDPNEYAESTPHIVRAIGQNKKMSELTPEERRKLIAEYTKWEDRQVYKKLLESKLIFEEGGSINNQLTDNDMKIRITGVPNQKMAYGGQLGYGFDLGQRNTYSKMPDNPYENVSDTMQPVPREQANIEAEDGETVLGDFNGDGQLEHNKVGGKRHSQGGTPLNVPEGSFVYSDTKKMRIKDPQVLKFFNMPEVKAGYTPADIAKKYDINRYKAILADPLADPIKKRTAELMLDTAQRKLAYLAVYQEGQKGFPQGVPQVAYDILKFKEEEPFDSSNSRAPLITMNKTSAQREMMEQEQAPEEEMNEEMGMMPEEGMQEQEMSPEEQAMMMPQQMYGGQAYYNFGGSYIPEYGDYAYGGLTEYRRGATVDDPGKKKKFKKKGKEVEAEWVKTVPPGFTAVPEVPSLYEKITPGSSAPGSFTGGYKIKRSGKRRSGNVSVEDILRNKDKYKTFWAAMEGAPDDVIRRAAERLVREGVMPGKYNPGISTPGSEEYVYLEDEPTKKQPGLRYACDPSGEGIITLDPYTPYSGETFASREEAIAYCQETPDDDGGEEDEEEQFDYGRKPFFGNQFAVGPKRYHAYAAPLAGYIPDPAFLDPAQELAANAAMATTLSRGYTGRPSQYAATATGVQMKALDNVANIIGRTGNANVQIANTFSPMQTQIMNNLMAYQADRMDKLHYNENMYDKEYRNTLRKYLSDWDKYRKGDYEYYTKRNMLNAVNPYYALVDTPSIYPGGNIQFRPDVDAYSMITGRTAPNFSGRSASNWKDVEADIKQYKDAGMDPTLIKEVINRKYGPATSSTGSRSSQNDMLNAYMQMFANQQQGDND